MQIKKLSEILDRQEIQTLQDKFSGITGVASVITDLDGTAFTDFSQSCSLCKSIRSTGKGRRDCLQYSIGCTSGDSHDTSIHRCPYTDLWETGVKIHVGGKHVANWIIGQVRPGDFLFSKSVLYAASLGLDDTFSASAIDDIPIMEEDEFKMILDILHLFVNQLSSLAYRKSLLKKEISEKKAIYRQLNYLNFHDPETGLINRELCEERISHLINVGLRTGRNSFSLIMLSLSGIKHHKELYGTDGVNIIIKNLAGILQSSIRNEDTVCRYSSDEFLIIIENYESAQNSPEVVYRRVKEKLNSGVVLEGERIKVQIFGGMATWESQDSIDTKHLIRKCYAALQESRKRNSQDLYAYTDDMYQTVMFEYELERSFEKAIEEEQIVPYFQPIIKVDDHNNSRIYGYEVLARWDHPEYGILMPGLFIPLAEQHNMLREMTEYIMRKGARFIKEMNSSRRHEEPLFISINITPDEFIRPDLVDMIKTTLTEEKIPGEWVKLEITENSILKGGEDSIAKSLKLNAMGISLSMDDFGTGYSNLSLLCRLPLNNLKLDKSLILMAEKNENFIQAVIRMADSLNLEIIAEGVEKQSQIDILKKMGCYLHQGFFYSLPLDAQTIKETGILSSEKELIY